MDGRATVKKGGKVDRFEAKCDRPEAMLKAIGAIMVSVSQKAFRQQSWDGKAWEPRKVPNVMGILSDFAMGRSTPPKRRFDERPALRDTGALSKSISFALISADTVEVGTNQPYASTMHYGGTSESKPVTRSVQDRLWKWLKKTGDKDLKRQLGWLLNPKMTGKTIKVTVPPRPFVGLTKDAVKLIHRAIGVDVSEVK